MVGEFTPRILVNVTNQGLGFFRVSASLVKFTMIYTRNHLLTGCSCYCSFLFSPPTMNIAVINPKDLSSPHWRDVGSPKVILSPGWAGWQRVPGIISCLIVPLHAINKWRLAASIFENAQRGHFPWGSPMALTSHPSFHSLLHVSPSCLLPLAALNVLRKTHIE